MQKAQMAQKVQHDRHKVHVEFAVGDQVMLHTRYLPLHVEKRKLSPRWLGPFCISSRVGVNAYKLKNLPSWLHVHDTFNVSQLKKYLGENAHADESFQLSNDEYEVEKIIKEKVSRGKTKLLVRWKGFGPEDDTWLSPEALTTAPDVLQAWEERRPMQPQRVLRPRR